jgi:hypothetical protein
LRLADVASEIRQTYVDIMAKITLDKFKAYLSSMKKLQVRISIEPLPQSQP